MLEIVASFMASHGKFGLKNMYFSLIFFNAAKGQNKRKPLNSAVSHW